MTGFPAGQPPEMGAKLDKKDEHEKFNMNTTQSSEYQYWWQVAKSWANCKPLGSLNAITNFSPLSRPHQTLKRTPGWGVKKKL